MKTYDMICAAVFAVLMAVCSWISIPTIVPFTMQTFALFLTMGVLGGKRSTFTVVIYILLGAAGIPVFAGFTGGAGVLLGTTGGYIIGFLLGTVLLWILESIFGQTRRIRLAAMVFAMILYYVFGTVWFMAVYARSAEPAGLFAVLSWCVFPFILPDLLKLGLAAVLSRRLEKAIPLNG